MNRVIALLLCSLAAPASAAPPGSYQADFRRDPARQDFVVQGSDDGRFAWIRGRELRVSLDSNEPSSRLVAPLGMTLDGGTSFRFEAELTLLSIEASPDDFFQLAFGPCNLATTGLNRTGTALPGPPFFVDDSDVFDSVEVAYFPNVTFFGGPFLQPAAFGAARGSAFANFAANFGPSADLGDNGPDEIRELPLGRRLRFVVDHDACRRQLTTRVYDVTSGSPQELATGLQPVDLSVLDPTGSFTLDAFAIHAYRDSADFDPSTRSLAAELDFHAAVVERLEAPAARLLPRALNADARAPARIALSGVEPAEGGNLVLVESAGTPVAVPLQGRPFGQGLLVEVPRDLARAPMTLDAGGCLVAVDGPVLVAPR